MMNQILTLLELMAHPLSDGSFLVPTGFAVVLMLIRWLGILDRFPTIAHITLEASASATNARVTLEELICELEPVTNWLVLGLHLGVPPEELRCIKAEHVDSEYSRFKMLGVFLERYDGVKQNWSTVVGALIAMGELQLAKTIATKRDCKCSS
jgi:hypothetical protein